MELLVENGFDVTETASGIEASWDSEPEIMLTDITVPDMDSSRDLEPKRWNMFRTVNRTLGQPNPTLSREA